MVQVRALVYSRVSTDAQERDGTSLDTQESACVEYAESNGWMVVERIRDTASGFTLDRQGIERAVELVLDQGYRTPDIAADGAEITGTTEMGRRIVEALL